MPRKKRSSGFIPDINIGAVLGLAPPSSFATSTLTLPAPSRSTEATLPSVTSTTTPGGAEQACPHPSIGAQLRNHGSLCPPHVQKCVPLSQTQQPLLAARKDAPVILSSQRAAKKRALEVAQNPELLANAVDAVVRDVHARSSAAPMSSYEKTWNEFHFAIYGEDGPPTINVELNTEFLLVQISRASS